MLARGVLLVEHAEEDGLMEMVALTTGVVGTLLDILGTTELIRCLSEKRHWK
jgi:hypothetical protein